MILNREIIVDDQTRPIIITSIIITAYNHKLESEENAFFSTASRQEHSPTNTDFMLVRPALWFWKRKLAD